VRVTNPLRLALGTLTILPVPAPGTVDRRVGSWAMTLAPLVGALLAVVSGAALWLLGGHAVPPLGAALVVGLLALLTRGMHLDGLADTADGLGSGKPPGQALEVMRRGDVGPFGVVTLVLVLLVQVLALAELVQLGLGAAGLLLALVVSRLALPVLCLRGMPAARPDGLGRVVVGSVGATQLLLSAALALGVLATAALALGVLATAVPALGGHALTGSGAVRAAAAAGLGIGVAVLVGVRAIRRLGGVTGDVLGAAVEAAFTTVLVVLALLA
jgi:adenosylcobinamide-GDP ribazoletransferase